MAAQVCHAPRALCCARSGGNPNPTITRQKRFRFDSVRRFVSGFTASPLSHHCSAPVACL
jgi:hypothetical protein